MAGGSGVNIGIVGGNSQVATELALLFRADDRTVYPIVRNKQGAAFLGYNGFDCRLADATEPAEMRDVLDDVDIVLVAAYAGIGSRSVEDYKDVWRTNNAIVRNSVRESAGDATVVHFSSVAAFGNDLHRSLVKGRLDQYAVSKRRLERLTLKTAREESKAAYTFRLGHVLGPSQSMAEKIRDPMQNNDHLLVDCNPRDVANVVHTVTIKDAIDVCIRNEVPSGRYTVVNNPQWTWRQTLEYYAPSSTSLEYSGRPNPASIGRAILESVRSTTVDLVVRNRMRLLPLQLFVPDSLNDRVVYEYKKLDALRRIRDEGFGEPDRLHTHEFSYQPVAGPFIDGLRETDDLLEEQAVIEDAFDQATEMT